MTAHSLRRCLLPWLPAALLVLSTAPAQALTPIARWDVVPNQRIDPETPFKAGVIAFSKAGIDKVRFSISGQSYQGPSTVEVSQMTLNDRTGVHEYWTPIDATLFGSAGPITVGATVVGADGGSRQLEDLTFIVNPGHALPAPEAWVAPSGGNDDQGRVGDRDRPFATIGGAAHALMEWRLGRGFGNNADGGIIRLLPGDHTMDNAGYSIVTQREWVTITNDPAVGGTRSNTVIGRRDNATNSLFLKVQGLTLRSSGDGQFLFNVGSDDPQKSSKAIWVDGCTLIGSGRYVKLSHPVGHNYKVKYFTDSLITDTHRGQGVGGPTQIARGLTIDKIGGDAFQNAGFIVDCTVRDVDPGPAGGHEWHADLAQFWGGGPKNVIIYNVHATDLHYQGFFAIANSPGRNIALVNCFVELRDPIRNYRNPGRPNAGTAFWGEWHHFLVWHCTFVNHQFMIAGADGDFAFTDSSVIGNVFKEFRTFENVSPGDEAPWTLPGNSEGNEFLHNHYKQSRTDGDDTAHYYSKSPDSGDPPTQSVGPIQLDLDPSSSTFGQPFSGSNLLDRMPFQKVGSDVLGRVRDSRPDLGPFELDGGAAAPSDDVPPAAPSGLRVVPES